jgi:hypothetical protein
MLLTAHDAHHNVDDVISMFLLVLDVSGVDIYE